MKKMSRKKGKRFKKQTNYNKLVIIIVCLVVVIGGLYYIFNYYQKSNTKTDDVKSETANENYDNGISEDEAKDIAIKQFATLGEEVKKDKLNVIRIQRNSKEFFYISSPNNTIEIAILDGKITRINSNLVEE